MDDEIVFSLKAFVDSLLKSKSPDLVYSRVLRAVHGGEKHTMAEWKDLLDVLRKTPVH